jgi:DNA uptake protein ComE-like DNA-binding protein
MSLPLLSPPHKKGSILILCLWALATLSILSLGLAGFVFQQIRFSSLFIRQTASLPMGKAAVLRIFEDRKKDTTAEYDSFEEITGENVQLLCDNVAYKYYLSEKKTIDGKEMFIDEGALVNINLASSEILKKLPGLNEDLAKKITESNRKPFTRKEEVLLVEGITKDIYNQFKDYVTVYGTGKININTVSSQVLSALGLDDELIDMIMRYRLEEKEGGAFTSTGTILEDLNKVFSVGLRQEQDFISIMNLLSVKSVYLRLNVIPQVKGKDGTRYSIVMHPSSKKIISWSEQ